MKLIKPSEISARILTLLDESDERVIIVSPYMKISKWYKFTNKLNELKTRGIITEIYVRDDPDNTSTFRDLDKLELEYKKIPHLHSKFYMSEKYGIVTSMNLLLSSEINSLEIGYATETWMDYNDLFGFYHRYIQIGEPVKSDTIASQTAADLNEIMHRIRETLNRKGKNSWLFFAENALHITIGQNSYSVSINDGCLRITALLRITSSTEQKSNQRNSLLGKKVKDLTAMKVYVQPGLKTDVLKLSGQAHVPMKSTCIATLLEDEAAYIMESVIRFIDATDALETFNSS